MLDAEAKHCYLQVVARQADRLRPEPKHDAKGKCRLPILRDDRGWQVLRTESKTNRMGQQLMVVVTANPKVKGKTYRQANDADEAAYKQASEHSMLLKPSTVPKSCLMNQ